MKMSISTYEGFPEFASFSCEMPDESTLFEFLENLNVLISGIYPNIKLTVEEDEALRLP